MTEFRDVNVGDKVRLTHKRIADSEISGKVDHTERHGMSIECIGWLYESAWSVEVLEKAPKPLPTEPGMYAIGNLVYRLCSLGHWYWVTDANMYERTTEYMQDHGPLEALVPVSEVESSRQALVDDIGEWLWVHVSDSASKRVRDLFGGKA